MAVNSGDFVQAAGLLNNLVEQANGDLEHLDMSLYISVGKNYDRESGGGAVTLQSKSITKTPTRQQQQQTVYPDPGFDGLSSVGVTVEAIPSEYVIPSGSVTITENGTVDVSGKAQAIVNVPTGGGEPALQQKAVTVTPTTQQQQQTVYPDPGFDGLSSVGVTVEAIPSEYVIPSGSVTITENGTVDVSALASAVVAVSGGGSLPDLGTVNAWTPMSMLHALSVGEYTTGTVTVDSYFPAGEESLFCDTGYNGNVKGIAIFDTLETPYISSLTNNLYFTFGFWRNSTAGETQSENTGYSCGKTRNTQVSKMFAPQISSYRLVAGKLYITPSAANTTTTFALGRTYRWIAWPYET